MTAIDFREISVDDLTPSPLKTQRRNFAEGPMAELTASVKEKGIIEPLVVRLVPKEKLGQSDGDMFEIVAGERRWRAATDAGLETVPCIVRTLTDREAMEMQLAENLQREDLSPIEEARGYRAMLDLEEGGKRPYTVPVLAAKIGKSEKTIYNRLQLLNLSGEAAEAVESGELPAYIGTLIGEIPGEAARAAAAEEIMHPKFQVNPLSKRQAQDLIFSQFRRSLNGVPWSLDDAKLYPEAGPCTTCPKRVEMRGSNVCTDLDCFGKKIDAEWSRWALSEGGKGRRVLSREENGRIKPTEWSCPYVFARSMPHSDLLHESAQTQSHWWEQLVKGQELEIVIWRDEDGDGIEMYDLSLAKTAARNNGHKIFKEDFLEREKPKPLEERKAEVQQQGVDRLELLKTNGEIATAIYWQLRNKMKERLTTKQLRAVLWQLAKQTDLVDDVIARRGIRTGDDGVRKLITKSGDVELDHLLVDLCLGPIMDPWSGELYTGDIEPVLNAFGLNSKPMIKQFRQEREKKAKAATIATLKKELPRALAAARPKPKKQPKLCTVTLDGKMTPVTKAEKPKRSVLTTGIVRALKAAGVAGITVKDIAAKLKVKPGNVFSWFYVTGKKVRNAAGALAICKVGEAKYAWRAEASK